MLMLLLFTNLEIFVVFLLMNLFKNLMFLDEEYAWFFKMTDLNFFMVMLVLILFFMMLMVEISFKMSLNLLLLVLVYIMMVSDFLVFFLLYEMVFVLIMFVIVLLGYSFERLMAAFMMMFYSFLFSSPTLMMIMLFDCTFLMKQWMVYGMLINYFSIGSFMVKFPIFSFHYWLPVAHVEASTIGSMLLAGVLLKLGSVGLMYVVMYMKFTIKFHWLSVSVIILMLMIMSLSDLKMMIAYSSVAHMSMVFYVMMTGTLVGKKGVVFMMFYHGVISPMMFWIIGLLGWWKTRSLMVIKLMSFSYLFILCLFILLILNMGFPPFMGFLSEILMLKSFVTNRMILFILVLSVLFSCYYNIYIFWCFTNFMGMIFKLNVFSMDLSIFVLLILLLNI